MALTAEVKDELSRVPITKTCCRKAELASLLRFAGGLHIIGGKIVVEAELDAANTARRVRRELMELYNHRCEVLVLAASGLRRGSRYVVRIVEGGELLASQTGLPLVTTATAQSSRWKPDQCPLCAAGERLF